MMKSARIVGLAVVCVMAGIAGVSESLSQKPPNQEAADGADQATGARAAVSLEQARDRAQVMHDVYESTLHALHHHYFHGDRAVVPARAMKDIFAAMRQQSKVQARWISVNTKPMSIEHEPQTDFEKLAAKEIAAGKEKFELVEDGFYRRAGAISLSGGCVGCHDGFFKINSSRPKFAGLVISVPIENHEPAKIE